MVSTGNLVWLASYPKSGSTWVRALLAAYDHPQAVVDLSSLPGLDAGSLQVFAHSAGIEATDVPASYWPGIRREAFLTLGGEVSSIEVIKVHEAFPRTTEGAAVFPAEVTRCGIYVVRHPMDVAVSWAFHSGISLDASVAFLCEDRTLGAWTPDGPGRVLPQHLGTWSQHVSSWIDQRDLPVVVLRYEDLHADPRCFRDVLTAIGRQVDENRLTHAIASARFSRLKEIEDASGFVERPSTSPKFFRAGSVGAYSRYLTLRQQRLLLEAHGVMMRQLGYRTDVQPPEPDSAHPAD